MKATLFLSLISLVLSQGQNLTGVDPSYVSTPNSNINFNGCFQDLATADRNGDGYVKGNEYLGFIQEYGKRKCFSTNALTLAQSAAFNSLACLCRAVEGASENCCIGKNAEIPTAGATNKLRTQIQQGYLTSVCRITDATIPFLCTPVPRSRSTPPPVVITPEGTSTTGGSDDGLSTGAILGIIAAAIALLLLLLLCCCCCVLRRKKMKQLEEVEDEQMIKATTIGTGEMAPEQAPRDLEVGPEMAAAAAANMAPAAEDEYEDDEGRKRRGGGNVGDDDDEAGRRIRGSGQLPPDDDPNKDGVNLRPVAPKDGEEDPDWDYPGRDINFPKPDPNDYEAGEYERYQPDGGVNWPQRPEREPIEPPNRKWERAKKEEPDEIDLRKHRIQSGLGEGEVWDKLGERDEPERHTAAPSGDVFDWVVQSALGVLDKSDEAGHLRDEDSTLSP